MKDDRARTKASAQILSGWKEIASYLDKGVRTVQRYERLLGLPVRRPAGKPRGSVVATTDDIDEWIAASPIRDALMLMRPATKSSSSTWANIQRGAAEMERLAKEMVDLRRELRNSVRLLRESIQEVQLRANEGGRRIEDRPAQGANLFNLLSSDTGGRKAS